MRKCCLSIFHFLIWIPCLWAALSLHAQEYKFKTLGVEDGLSQISVSAICQDEKSRIWIATLDGLNCYDGSQMKVYNHFYNDSISYGNLYVTQMVADGQGSLFLLCSTGVFQFDLHTETYKLLPFRAPVALAKGREGVWIADKNLLYLYRTSTGTLVQMFREVPLPDLGPTMIEAADASLWMGLKEGGLMRLDSTGTVSYDFPDVQVMQLLSGKEEQVWVGTREKGVYRFSAQGRLQQVFAQGDLARALCQDAEGNIWVGYRKGMSKIEVNPDGVSGYQPVPNNVEAMSKRSVTCLYTDKQGTVWIGTYWGGVYYFSPEYQHYTHFNSSGNRLSFPVIGSMAEDHDGNIWICTEGGGLDMYSPQQNSFRHFNHETGHHFTSEFLKDVLFDEANHCLWIAADFSNQLNCFHLGQLTNEVIRLEQPGGPSLGEALFSLAQTPETLYVGATSSVVSLDKKSGKIEVIYHQEGLFTHNYNTLLLDSKRNLWFAVDQGCVAYNIDTRQLRTYPIRLVRQVQSQKQLVNIIYEDAQGTIWVGTHGCGLFALDEEKAAFVLHTPGTAFSGDNIRDLEETPSGKLLIGTGHGLSLLDKHDGHISNFNFRSGFPLTLVNQKALLVAHDQTIYMGGNTGMISIREDYLHYPPKVYHLEFTQLYVNNQVITPGDDTHILQQAFAYTDSLSLDYTQNMFSIGFFTDNFLHIGGGEVEFRLGGYKEDWSELLSGNYVTYTNLSPGEYLFQIRLKNFPDVMRSLHITVVPPFYNTWWAYLFYAGVVAAIFFFVIREYRIRLFLKASLDLEMREKQYIEELNQSKLRFFTYISHEIRTPVTLILGQVDVLLNSGKLSTYAYSKLLNIHKNAANLKSLISELLDFRKQEQGRLKLKISRFDLHALLLEHYVLFKELAANRRIDFTLHADGDACMLWGDRLQLQKVVNNLLSNAFKYTPDGGRIELRLADGADTCSFAVRDTGPGISETDSRHLFEHYYQVEHTGQNSGTGIGLALSYGIVKAHHGDISVESQLGEGACFTVCLQKGEAHFDASVTRLNAGANQEYVLPPEDKEALMEEIRLSQQEHHTADCTLLVIDDNEEIRSILVDIFSPLYKVETACNGKEGYEKVKALQPDLVISDIMMPEMPGTELCAKMKHNMETCHIPVVLLTALGAPERELEGLRIGADIYVVKPFNMRRLVMQCNNLINTRRMLQQKYAHQPGIQAEKIATNELDQKFIEQATRIVETNLDNPDFSVDIFSREMGVGRTVLFQKIKGITGTTPNNFIMNLRLKKAAYLLVNAPEMNVSDVAYQLGFGNPQYFNKCFKELFTVTPSQYRKTQTVDSTPVQD